VRTQEGPDDNSSKIEQAASFPTSRLAIKTQ
jgi:hypothetical protein